MKAYTATTPNSADAVQVTSTDPAAQIQIRCGDADIANGGSATWQAGANTLTITVTNSGEQAEYTVTVTYVPPTPPDAKLSQLTIGNLTFDPAFAPDTYDYTAATTNATNTVTATAKDSDAEVSIDIDGETHANGTAATWTVGENVVTIKVKSGDATSTYTVKVTKE